MNQTENNPEDTHRSAGWRSGVLGSRRKKMFILIVTGVLVLVILLNVLAFLHARAMTHFSAAGDKTKPPEQMSFFQKARVLLTGVNLPRPANLQTPPDYQLEYETFVLREGTSVPLEIWQVAAAQPKGLVLMFHGYGGSKDTMLPTAKLFHEMGFACWLVDLRGCGGSGGNVTSVGFFEADDVAKVFRRASEQWKGRPIILYGGSMGAVAALRAVAVLGIKPAALMLECPYDSLLSTVKTRFHVMGLPAFPMAHLLVFWGGAQQGFNGFELNSISYAKKVRCDTLLMQGADDARVSEVQAYAIYKALAGRAYFQFFDKVGHESYAKAAPEEWRRAVENFLAGGVSALLLDAF